MIDPTWAKGIDVSHWNAVKDWGAIPPEILMFAAKATEGDDFVDPTLAGHRDGARARGFDLVKFFHVARPGDAAAHARRILQVVGARRPNERIVLDIEGSSDVDIDYVETFYGELERQGALAERDLGYWSRRVWEAMGNPAFSRAGTVGLWAPRYRSGGQPPALPPPWPDWDAWQWTDGGKTGDPYSCPGVGPCDASVFHGDRDALRAFAGG